MSKRKTCENCGCSATYGFREDMVPLRCFHHRDVLMVDVGSLFCKYKDCSGFPGYISSDKIRPRFMPISKNGVYDVPEYCIIHKLDNMVIPDSMRCVKLGCRNKAVYNYEYTKFQESYMKNECPAMCKRHMRSGMINTNGDTEMNIKINIKMNTKVGNKRKFDDIQMDTMLPSFSELIQSIHNC